MSYQTYTNRLQKLVKKLQTLDQFRKEDTMVDFVFKTARSFFDDKLDNQAIGWLLSTGGKLTAVFSYLEVKANEHDAISKLAAITNKSVRDAIIISVKSAGVTITEARAKATEEMFDADIDVVLKELTADNYQTASRAASTMAMFIQSVLKNKKHEQTQANLQDEV